MTGSLRLWKTTYFPHARRRPFSLAARKSERWVMARTGHSSRELIGRDSAMEAGMRSATSSMRVPSRARNAPLAARAREDGLSSLGLAGVQHHDGRADAAGRAGERLVDRGAARVGRAARLVSRPSQTEAQRKKTITAGQKRAGTGTAAGSPGSSRPRRSSRSSCSPRTSRASLRTFSRMCSRWSTSRSPRTSGGCTTASSSCSSYRGTCAPRRGP